MTNSMGQSQPSKVPIEPAVLVLDDSEDLCDLICQLIKLKFGVGCISSSSYDDLVRRETEWRLAKIAFLDINLGEGRPSGLDALAFLKNNEFGGQVFFLTGHAPNHPLVKKAEQTGTRVLVKPLPTDDLIAVVRGALVQAP